MSAKAQRDRSASDGAAVGGKGLLNAVRKVTPFFIFVLVPVALVIGLINFELHQPTPVAFWDFHAFWNAGRAVLHGHSPYPPARASVLAHEDSFVYPAPAALVMVPFALLPFKLSAALFGVALIGSITLALHLVGVRDWRCYGIALITAPVWNSLAVDAVSPILALGLAVAWRYRDRVLPAACAVAALVVLKLFLWPLLLWFAFTRRLTTALTATAIIVLTSLASWTIIGFDGLRAYPNILSILTRLLEGKGYTLVALGLSLGASTTVARALPFLVGIPILGAIALGGRRPGADTWTYTFVIGASFALTPIAWLHYFVLLFVPIAIVRPWLSWLWAAPLALWILGGQSDQPLVWERQVTYTDLAHSPRIGHAPLIAWGLAVATVILVGVSVIARAARTQELTVTEATGTQ